MSDAITLELADGIATVTINDAATLNALTPQMAATLLAVFRQLDSGPPGIRAAILTGSGRAFCSGLNLATRARQLACGAQVDFGATLESCFNPLALLTRDLRMPLIAAVNGAAVGVGAALALLADLVLVAENAYFLLPFCKVGNIPDGGLTYALPRLIGKARAMELALLGEKLPAAKAFEWGLVNRVVAAEALLSEARSLASRLAQGPCSLGAMRRAMTRGLEQTLAQQLELELSTQRSMGETADYREGISAFMEKRPPRFNGC